MKYEDDRSKVFAHKLSFGKSQPPLEEFKSAIDVRRCSGKSHAMDAAKKEMNLLYVTFDGPTPPGYKRECNRRASSCRTWEIYLEHGR